MKQKLISPTIDESTINLISQGTRIQGKVRFERVCRVHGQILGDVEAIRGSTLILGETGVIEGDIQADTLLIDGFVQGNIRATTRIVISGTGRVIGNIHAPSLRIEFGAYFEGISSMEEAARLTSGPSQSPA